MTQQTLPLITFYQGWENYQHRLVTMIAPLSSAQLAGPVASHHWTIRRLIQHLVADRVWWFQGWLGVGSPELAPLMHWNPGDAEEPSALEAAELVAGLESTWGVIEEVLATFTVPIWYACSPLPPSRAKKSRRPLGTRHSSGWSGMFTNTRSITEASCP